MGLCGIMWDYVGFVGYVGLCGIMWDLWDLRGEVREKCEGKGSRCEGKRDRGEEGHILLPLNF
jgi:hypothetical protein